MAVALTPSMLHGPKIIPNAAIESKLLVELASKRINQTLAKFDVTAGQKCVRCLPAAREEHILSTCNHATR
jgi:hypothetical protein